MPVKPKIGKYRQLFRPSLGDSSVELKYHGTNNGRGNVSMRFMPANVMYVVDWIVIGRMPYKDLIGYDINGMIHSPKLILRSSLNVSSGSAVGSCVMRKSSSASSWAITVTVLSSMTCPP